MGCSKCVRQNWTGCWLLKERARSSSRQKIRPSTSCYISYPVGSPYVYKGWSALYTLSNATTRSRTQYSRLPHNPYPIKCILLDKSHKFEQVEKFAFATILTLFMVGIISAPHFPGPHFPEGVDCKWTTQVLAQAVPLVDSGNRNKRARSYLRFRTSPLLSTTPHV